MSKHTTLPNYGGIDSCRNSHTKRRDEYPVGNWNRHKKRRIPSRVRTVGRHARAMRRLIEKKVGNIGMSQTQFAVLHGRGWLNRYEAALKMNGRLFGVK